MGNFLAGEAAAGKISALSRFLGNTLSVWQSG
jgi:hypothetical protein